jgi:YD repeat-containing protein
MNSFASASNSSFTQAGNFIGAAQGGVDPRTGIFSANMPIASLAGNSGLGPEIELALSYSPFSQTNPYGFGIGCTLGFSYYIYETRTLYMSTGEQYKIVEDLNKNTVTVSQKRLNSFDFVKVNKNGAWVYQIIDKSGEIQELRGVGDDYFPMTITSPSNRRIELSWTNQGAPRLIEIRDESTVLCHFTYGSSVIADVLPGTSKNYQIIFEYQNGFLTALTNTALVDDTGKTAPWKLGYNTDGMLTSLASPTGYTQAVKYNMAAIAMPESSKLPPLPAVTSYTETPGFGQPVMRKVYGYNLSQGHSYTGANNRQITSWTPNDDVLMSTAWYPEGNDYYYTYGSVEQQLGNNDEVLLTTERTFNSLHLQIREKTIQENCITDTRIEYPLLAGKNVDGQPSKYQLPTRQSSTWEDLSLPEGQRSRTEITESESDDAGNPVWEKAADGTVTITEYYPAAGEGDLCPADPHGFTLYTKSKKVIPAPSDFDDVPVMETRYTYTKVVSSQQEDPAAYAVLQTSEQHFSDATLRSEKKSHYITDIGSPHFGRVAGMDATIYEGEEEYTSSAAFTYALNGESLDQTATFSSFDKLAPFSVLRNQCRFTGQVSAETDRQKNLTEYKYDLLGRLLEKVMDAGTQYVNKQTTSYHLSTSKITTQRKDNSGNIQWQYFDGMGRVIRETRNTAAGNTSEFSYLSNTYDLLGRLASSQSEDRMSVSSAPDGRVRVVADELYDNWGQNFRTRLSSKQIEVKRLDPVTLQAEGQYQTEDKEAQPLGKQVATLNVQQLPIKIEQIDSAGNVYSTVTKEYDGAQRLRVETDALGRQVSYEYDIWDRVISQTLPDGSVVRKTYAPFSNKELAVTISITAPGGEEQIIGTREYDSLFRLVENSCGGRVQRLTYEGSSPVPNEVETPAGDTLSCQYIAELDNSLASVMAKNSGLTQTRQYDPLTGNMITATDSSRGNMTKALSYSPEGKLIEEAFTPQAGQERSMSYTWSVMGKVESCTDVGGAVQTYQYDEYGRPVKIEDPAATVVVEYDSYGRKVAQTATDKATGNSQTTALTLDDFSRETKRVVTAKVGGQEQEIMTITQAYNVNSQVEQRITSQAGVTLREETYEYDERNRLVDYTCEGTQCPQDSYGNTLERQTFTFDHLSNVTQCITTSPAGEDIATYIFANPQDPCQLTAVTHTLTTVYPARIDLQYDANGRMIVDEAGRTLTYDAFGRLDSVNTQEGDSSIYGYDGNNTLVTQTINDSDTHQLYYKGGILTNEVMPDSGSQVRYVKVGSNCAGVVQDKI